MEDRLSEHQQVIRAEQFEVVDEKGRTRILMGMRDGQPLFELLRDDGGVGVSVGFREDQTPNILIRDQKSRVRVEVRLYNDDNGEGDGEYPSIGLTGYNGRTRAYMTVTPHDYGEIGVEDDNHGVVLLNECG